MITWFLGVLDSLRMDLGMRVPEDVQVAVFDDDPLAAWSGYLLTTVKQDSFRWFNQRLICYLKRLMLTPIQN